MRMSKNFTLTLRDAPADAELPGYACLLRAGYIQPAGSGIFIALPFGELLLQQIATTALRCLDPQQSSQAINLPLVVPAALGAVGTAGFSGHGNREYALGSDDARLPGWLARTQIRTYRQLPARLHANLPVWSNLTQTRGGWLNSRYTRALVCYQMHARADELVSASNALAAGLDALFAACKLPILQAEGAANAREWHFESSVGETALTCPGCGYHAAQNAARFQRDSRANETPQPLEKVATPHCPTIASLAAFLNISADRTAKAVFLVANLPAETGVTETLLFAVVRGDRDVNESALLRLTGARSLRPATDAEIEAVGAVPGYASPLGISGARVIVDEEIPQLPNLVSGANAAGYHLRGVTFGRDYTGEVAPIALAQPGDRCPRCAQPLEASATLCLAALHLHDPLENCVYRAEDGQLQPVLGLSARVDLQRLAAAVAETHHDAYGLRLPAAVAPLPLHLVLLGSKTGQTETLAEELYARWQQNGRACLFDDRAESPGVKFNDADLIGLPLRVTVSERALRQGGLELKLRGGEAFIAPLDSAESTITQILAAFDQPAA